MLESNGSLPLSQYSGLYDIVVKKDHKLRKILELIDFTFVYDELKDKYCPDNGRTAKDPVMMFKYLFLKSMYVMSDRRLIERCESDMAFKFFLGLNPEDDVIAPTTLTKFRRQRLADVDMMDLLLKKSMQVAIDHKVVDGSTVIVDATHSFSRSNPVRPTEMLQKLTSNLRKAVYGIDEAYKKRMPRKYEGVDLKKEMKYVNELVNFLSSEPRLMSYEDIVDRIEIVNETVDDIRDHYTTSCDKDARIGHKSADTEFFGYKTHIAMTTERLVAAATVTSGEKSDGKELPGLISKAKEILPDLERVVGDGAYAGNTNLEDAHEQGIAIVAKVNPGLLEGSEIERRGFTFNKDAGMMVCPAGHLAISKRPVRRKEGECDRLQYTFSRTVCRNCSRRSECKAIGRAIQYSVPIRTQAQKRQLQFMATDEFKRWAKERYKIEAKNSELKNQYGYDRADYYGLYSMKLQGAVALFASNVSRILRLMDDKA